MTNDEPTEWRWSCRMSRPPWTLVSRLRSMKPTRLTRTRSATGGVRRGLCGQVCGSGAQAVTRGAC